MTEVNKAIETVTTDTTLKLKVLRVQVPEGWIVIVQDTDTSSNLSTSTTHDPQHQWEIPS